ncbi:MAG: hypothetical protein M1579_03745, partial [Gammaproteobacteria bacterium]|nr:hypothetical protein [Gammaproteobacteria bacterium]
NRCALLGIHGQIGQISSWYAQQGLLCTYFTRFQLRRFLEVTHSIRINDQWRICFVWKDGAHQVEIVDYH